MRYAAWVVAVAVTVTLCGCHFFAGGLPADTNQLEALTVDQARAIVERKGYVSLRGLTALSDEVAKVLAQHEGDLDLSGLATLSDEAAKAFAQHKGYLDLDGLTTLSDEAAKTLRANREVLLPKKFRR
jgi:hypothetical protein